MNPRRSLAAKSSSTKQVPRWSLYIQVSQKYCGPGSCDKMAFVNAIKLSPIQVTSLITEYPPSQAMQGLRLIVSLCSLTYVWPWLPRSIHSLGQPRLILFPPGASSKVSAPPIKHMSFFPRADSTCHSYEKQSVQIVVALLPLHYVSFCMCP